MWMLGLVCALATFFGTLDIGSSEGIPHHLYHKLHIHNKSARRHRAIPNDGALRFDPEPFSSKKMELNSSGKIHCRVAGGAAPVVQWFMNDADALPSGMTSSNGTLIVTEATQRVAGKYTCQATDGVDVISFKITLDIVVKPRILEPENGAQLHVTEGTDVYINCIATGEPAPSIHWDKNITMLSGQLPGVSMEGGPDSDTASIVIYNNGTLLLRNVSRTDADKFGCTAGSAAGLQRADLYLYVHPVGEVYDDSGVGSKAVVISISVACAYMVLVVALMLYCRRSRLRNRERGEKLELELAEGREKLVDENDDDQQKLTNGTGNGRLLPNEKDSGADNSESCVSRGSKKSGQYDHLAVPRALITDHIVLGRGEFGEVSLAKIDMGQLRRARNKELNKSTAADVRPVLVKALTSNDESQLCEFRRQLELFSRVRHENVARLIGLCNDTEPHCILLQHTDWGDLKRFLISTRTHEEHAGYVARVGSTAPEARVTEGRGVVGSAPALLPPHALLLALHLARGNAALAHRRFTHRDIASRNCIISSKLHLKLTLPALTRGPYSHEYYKLHDQVIPLRWLPLEVVNEGDYSTKSDVYMFAATVWEIYTKAELPFAKLNDNSVLDKLRNGGLEWPVPGSMPEKLAVLLKQCWNRSPTARPLFDTIVEEINVLLQDASADNVAKSTESLNQ